MYNHVCYNCEQLDAFSVNSITASVNEYEVKGNKECVVWIFQLEVHKI